MVRLAILNLTRNRRRTILTILDIAISVFVLAVLLSLPAIADRALSDRRRLLQRLTRIVSEKKWIEHPVRARFIAEIGAAVGRGPH